MRHPWIWALAAIGCGPPPVATYTVACDDEDCTTAVATADDIDNATAFRWILDGATVETGPTFVYAGAVGVAEALTLEATGVGGTASSERWLVPNEAVSVDATGGWSAIASGFEIVSLDRTVDTECGPFAVISSIGGCFAADAEFGIFLSMPTADSASPPSPLSSAAWTAPATFSPGSPAPIVQRGGWDAAVAWSGTGSVSDSWDPATPSASTDVPRFEAGYAPSITTAGRWAVVSLPGPPAAFHASALYLQCEADNSQVIGVPIEDRLLDAWAADAAASR